MNMNELVLGLGDFNALAGEVSRDLGGYMEEMELERGLAMRRCSRNFVI